jgi:hypothetical protein
MAACPAFVFLAGLWVAAVPQNAGEEPDVRPKPSAPAYQFSGPFTHQNLTIFLVQGEDRLKGKQFLLLSEALEQKKFVINETKAVSQLEMENLSPTDEVLILAGDILKGGQQDRVARYDLIVPPKSGKLALTVHCVERTAGRWMRAWKEGDKTFNANLDCLNSKELRLANSFKMSQHEVWKEVTNAQANLTKKIGKDVKAKESDSSLQLTLKAKEVMEAADKYTAALDPIVKDKKDVIGYAFAINGKVYGADIYGSAALFRKVWPRLLRANAIEAVAELDKKKHPAVAVEAVRKFLADSNQGKTSSSDVAGIHRIQEEGKTNVRIESQASKGMALRVLHIAY